MSLDELNSCLQEVLAPLVEADQGELFLISASDELVKLHLKGRFAGCPGNALVTEEIIGPIVRSVLPKARVEVSSGALLPRGAQKLSSNEVRPAEEVEKKDAEI